MALTVPAFLTEIVTSAKTIIHISLELNGRDIPEETRAVKTCNENLMNKMTSWGKKKAMKERKKK